MILQTGDQFDRYQINSHLAQGGMSDIYIARDLTNGNEVVLKIPNRMMIGDPAQYERFQRELQVMKTLSHPSIQKGVASGQFNRTPYLVTERVSGQSMREFIEKNAPLSPEQAIALICKIADAVAYIHENEVVHRDLKPENILITAEGKPVLLDFGLALTKESRRVTYANLSATSGTPDYMSPEQIEGQRGDQRSDIYALGTILYELLSSETPYVADNTMAVMSQHLRGAIPRLDKDYPNISTQLAATVAKTLQKNPDDRYPTVRAFIDALEHPETVDTAILDHITGESTRIPFYRSQAFIAIVASIVIIVGIIVFAVVVQATRAPR